MNATFVEAIQKANIVLLTTPEAIELSTDHNEVRWSTMSAPAKKARVEIRKILNDLWQSGAYNYDEIAKSLRVGSIIIQALIDEQYIEAKGL